MHFSIQIPDTDALLHSVYIYVCVYVHTYIYIYIHIIICNLYSTSLFIILDWACDWNGSKVAEEKYIDSINKAAYNKRKAHNQAKRISKNKDAKKTITLSQEQQTIKRGQEQTLTPLPSDIPSTSVE